MIRNREEQGCCVVLSEVLVIKALAWLSCIEPGAGDRQTVGDGVQFHTAPLTGLRACAGQFYLLIIGIPLTQAKRRDPLDSLSWNLLMPLRMGQTSRPVSFTWKRGICCIPHIPQLYTQSERENVKAAWLGSHARSSGP